MRTTAGLRGDTVLRAAAGADAAAIAALWHAGWADGHAGHVPPALHAHRRLAHFRALATSRVGGTILATRGRDPVGFVTVREDEVEQLYVAASARGSGVADALIGRAERDIAVHHGRAWLAVVAGNARARRFYTQAGWRDTGPVDYHAQIAGGTLVVPCRRYEKRLQADRATAADVR